MLRYPAHTNLITRPLRHGFVLIALVALCMTAACSDTQKARDTTLESTSEQSANSINKTSTNKLDDQAIENTPNLTKTQNASNQTTTQNTSNQTTTQNIAKLDATKPWLALSTKQGRYAIEIAEDYSTVPAGEYHYWDLRLFDSNGQAVTPNQFVLSGSMPGHGHGMTTFPEAMTGNLAGAVRVIGIKFHMSGDWRMQLVIDGPAGDDRVTFDIVIAPPPVKASKPIKQFDETQLALLKSLHIDQLPKFTGDPTNRFSQNSKAIELGSKLFFDEGLSGSKKVSCASCHNPDKYFTDGLVVSHGSADTQRHSPSLIGVAWQRWFYWDGRRDSLWSQGLTPIETPGEMDSTRVDALHYVLIHSKYSETFRQLTGIDLSIIDALEKNPQAGPFSDQSGKEKWFRLNGSDQNRINQGFANIGKIIAAYEETLIPSASMFDQFVTALIDENEETANGMLTDAQRRGALLFIDAERTQCMRCHNGPLLTNREFHNIATGIDQKGTIDFGRLLGLQAAVVDPFNCSGAYSDAAPDACRSLKAVRAGHLDNGAFKTPSLRHIADTAPYMHDGRFGTLEEVVEHYLKPNDAFAVEHEMPELNLDEQQVSDLVEFLKIL